MKALWRPAWYELDESLVVDAQGEYAFCGELSAAVPQTFDLVFHNPLLAKGEPLWRRVRIVRIRHAVLGDVERVETTGLTYTMTLADGGIVRIEAEETPGRIEYMPPPHPTKIDSWDLEVELGEFVD